jgi:hypothetical protein
VCNEVVGDDAKPDPALHSGIALIAAAAEPISPFDHADASLASGPLSRPYLRSQETLSLIGPESGAMRWRHGGENAMDAPVGSGAAPRTTGAGSRARAAGAGSTARGATSGWFPGLMLEWRSPENQHQLRAGVVNDTIFLAYNIIARLYTILYYRDTILTRHPDSPYHIDEKYENTGVRKCVSMGRPEAAETSIWCGE